MSTLVIMAAGMGSRYNGLKQIDEVGPSGEVLMDYSIGDAIKSGFKKIVLIVGEDFLPECQKIMKKRWGDRVDISYSVQRKDELPAGFELPSLRQKPWGTGQALLAAKANTHGPFALINADDFYGRDAFEKMHSFLSQLGPDEKRACLLGYTLKNTTSPHGSVSRGVCQVEGSGDKSHLSGIVERKNIVDDHEAYYWLDGENTKHNLTGSEIVSMNFWGFNLGVFAHIESEFEKFLEKNLLEPKKEFLIPEAVNTLVEEGRLQVDVIQTSERWFGMTYPEDKPKVTEQLHSLESPTL